MNLNSSLNSLFVFSTQRKIRDFYSQFSNSLLPKALTIGEFIAQAVLVKNLKKSTKIDEILLMQAAASRVKNVSETLKIPNEFFAFLKNSEYLFSFFKELKREYVDIDDLKNSDTYARYDEHLDILKQLESEYLPSLEAAGFYDDISICSKFSINYDFIKTFERIHIEIDGILSKFEWNILSQIAEITRVELIFRASKFNRKLTREIENLTQIKVENGFDYKVNLSEKKLISCEKFSKKIELKLKDFSFRSAQCAFVFDEISRFIRAGIAPEGIIVITPDEEFSDILRANDERNMLNFARGEEFKNTDIYILLNALKSALDASISYEFTSNYLTKSQNLVQDTCTLNYFGLKGEIYADFLARYNLAVDFIGFKNLMNSVLNSLEMSDEIRIITGEIIFELGQIISRVKLSLHEVFELFLSALKDKNLSIVGGGKVTVMGILESRGLERDGVIIVDFNDNLVPRRSEKEMFLSSAVRAKAGLIGHKDRQDLQRFYYENIISCAKFVSISYVQNDENSVSRFIKNSEFNFAPNSEHSQSDYLNSLKNRDSKIDFSQKEIIKKCEISDVLEPLSFSRLQTFLVCKRKFYYSYIRGIKEQRNLSANERPNIDGMVIHEALNRYFRAHNDHFDEGEFLKLWNSDEFKKYCVNEFGGFLDVVEESVFKLKLAEFAKNQAEHFAKGYKVYGCELEKQNEFLGIKITGKIDRIDILGRDKLIIDYKTGRTQDSLQLSFYQALLGEECECKFFDLKDTMNFVKPNDKKADNLDVIINELKTEFASPIEFTQTTNHKACNFCPYILICKKEIK